MYPQRELNRLDAYKVVLLRDIAANRAQCLSAARQATQPLVWIDRLLEVWKKLTPLTMVAAIPLGFIFKRTIVPKLKILSLLVRWAPFAFAAMRGIQLLGKRTSSNRTRTTLSLQREPTN